MPIARSYLFVPANRPERFDKALASGAHRVIVDLEDAVPPDEKDAARACVPEHAGGRAAILLRLNAAGTAAFEPDLRMAAQLDVAGLVLPKVESVAGLEDLHRACPGQPLYPMIESAQGLDQLAPICRAPGVRAVIFGALDFALDIGAEGDQALLYARSQLVLQSRLAGIEPPVDGVTPAIDDHEAVAGDARHARALGFGGKTCIHPRQIPVVNQVFRPTEAEIQWAQRVVAAAAQSRGGAVAVDGHMVDRPVICRAERILEDIADV